MPHTLSTEDVTRLLSNPSETARAETARKIASQFDAGSLSEKERTIAEDIFRIMVDDAAVRVRQALSSHLKECREIPHDLAVALARDVDEVALPMLQFSEALTDADLIEIVHSRGPAKEKAVAQRRSVSAAVAGALVESDNEEVVATLMANDGADLTEPVLQAAIDRFGDSDAVTAPMVRRNKLPITVAERLVTLVSAALQDYLVTHHELPATIASDMVLQSRERATVSLLSADSDLVDVERLVEQLRVNGRLTPTIILRALCTGDLAFFEASLSLLSTIPVDAARVLIHDEGTLGLKAVYERAGLPRALYPAMRVAVDVIHETEYDGEAHDRERYKCRVLERILTQFEELGAIGSDNLDYLIGKLSTFQEAAQPAHT